MRTALVYFVVLLCVALMAAESAHAQGYWNGTDWLLWWIRR